MEATILAFALIVLAAVFIGVGLAGLTERLPRNPVVGIRVASVRADAEGWRKGHRAAGGAMLAAAGPPLLLGVALLVMPPDDVGEWFLVFAVVGVITGGLVALAVRQADRAAGGGEQP